jgi:prepilin-type N-terminal cleavage/methylation domain-containing protein
MNTNKGFTLLEVLVSAAILAIVMAVLLAILSTSLTTWRSTQGKIEVDAEGRSGALLLMQDIDNIIMPNNVQLWPNSVTNSGTPYFRFLTLKPQDYQSPDQGDVGDICYVEYFFDKTKGNLMRRFYASKWTYENILKTGRFPPPIQQNAELLSTNLLTELKDSVRKTPLFNEAGQTGFVLLATNNNGQTGAIMPHKGPLNTSNPPIGVEINFSPTDMTSHKNRDLLADPNYRLRNSGYFSMRFEFPKPHTQ